MNLKDPEPCPVQHRCWNVGKAENGNCPTEMDDVLECFVDVEDMGELGKCPHDKPYYDFTELPCETCKDKPCLVEVLPEWEKRTGRQYGKK